MSQTKKFKGLVERLVEESLREMFNDVLIYDNGGETADRYTVVIEDDVYNMSHNPLMPNGVNMYAGRVGEDIELPDGDEWGGRIDISEVPEQVQKAIYRHKTTDESKATTKKKFEALVERIVNKKLNEEEDKRPPVMYMADLIFDTLMNNSQYEQFNAEEAENPVVTARSGNIEFTYRGITYEVDISVEDDDITENDGSPQSDENGIGGHPITIDIGGPVDVRNGKVVIIAKDQAFKKITSALKQAGISYDIDLPF